MHKTFISYHHANEQGLKDHIIESFGGDFFLDKSVKDGDINTDISEESIMRKIREDFLKDSTVTLVLIGIETFERPFINSELQASLWGDHPNGLLAVVTDAVYDLIFRSVTCSNNQCNCGEALRQQTSLYSYYLPELVYKNHVLYGADHYTDNDVYCTLTNFSTFIKSPESYIDHAFDKRSKGLTIAKRLSPETPKI
ncbi:hypothetical protein ES071_15400 [Bacillus velezensis]|uniref:TIR domain-containing protein n=1 Tax=Bacillus velezensis TaxID=492670 RepID=UPI00102E5FAA|nr:TIR domain-containing protein [Bacillus velezensis]TAI26338.1 hypothetical protein ES071_15400 [Bacillus velezensis]